MMDENAPELCQAFFKEAQDIWKRGGATDALVHVSALQYVSFGCHFDGNEALSRRFLDAARDMALRMALIGSNEESTTDKDSETPSGAMARARAHVAWGMFLTLV